MPHVDPGQKILLYDKIEQLSHIEHKKVLVGGCFDVLHFGHFVFLHQAAHQGEVLIVALESDEFMKSHKKKKPVHTQEQRAQILAGLGFVDCVIPLPLLKSDKEYESMVASIAPHVIAVTEDDERLAQKQEHARKTGAQVVVVTPRLAEFSSSSITES